MNVNHKNLIAINTEGEIFTLDLQMKKANADIMKYLEESASKIEMVVKFTKDLYMARKGKVEKFAKRITQFNLKTYYNQSADNENHLRPIWHNQEDAIMHDLIVKVPDSMRLVLMSIRSEIFMLALSMKTGRIYRLPLPNVYSDGKVCMGDSYYHDQTKSVEGQVNDALEVFTASQWNTDLLDESSRSERQAMWNFDMNTGDFIEMPENWEDYCSILTKDSYNEFAKRILEKEGYVKPGEEKSEGFGMPDAEGWITWPE